MVNNTVMLNVVMLSVAVPCVVLLNVKASFISIKIEKKERARGQHPQDLAQEDADKPKKEWKHLDIGKKSTKKP
jgi:hypothetical protein